MARKYAKCQICGETGIARMMVKSECANRGKGKFAYLCEYCATHNENYASDRDNPEIGKVFDGFRFGLEFETIASTLYFRNMMGRYNFTPTHDCSLTDDDMRGATYLAYGDEESSCEYVSDTNRGMKRFTKQFVEMERCLAEGHVYMDSTCGTHCHISFNNMERGEMGMIREYFKNLFKPMEQVMEENELETTLFFGRFFNDRFAPRINWRNERQSSHGERYCWVNATNDSNLEFRINKFNNAKQMRECIMFEKWVVKTIVNNFTSKYYEEGITPEVREVLANKTGAKLAKKLAKIYSTLIFED